MKTLCLYHASCADGLGAAWSVYRALGPDVEFVAASYGGDPMPNSICERHEYEPDQQGEAICVKCGAQADEEFTNCVGRDILIVDFSYPLEVLKAMAKEARSVLVLDHHKTAQKDLKQVNIGPAGWLEWQDVIKHYGDHELATIFDLERSGAGLTWDYLAGKPRPRIIDLIEDRDLWKFAFGDESKAFHAVLASYDWSDLKEMFERLDKWNRQSLPIGATELEGPWTTLITEGHAILRAQQQAVAAAVAASRRTIKIAGQTVPCANVPGSMASDAGHLLCNENMTAGLMEFASGVPQERWPFSATYYDGPDRRHFSLRSPEGGADVGQIAKEMAEKFNRLARGAGFNVGLDWSGGGHTHAAGFDAPLGWKGE